MVKIMGVGLLSALPLYYFVFPRTFGLELPERKSHRKHQHGGFFDQLTEEQKLLIDSKVKDM